MWVCTAQDSVTLAGWSEITSSIGWKMQEKGEKHCAQWKVFLSTGKKCLLQSVKGQIDTERPNNMHFPLIEGMFHRKTGRKTETYPCSIGINYVWRAKSENNLAASIQNCTLEGRANNSLLLLPIIAWTQTFFWTQSDASVWQLCGLFNLVWHQFQGFFCVWYTAATELTMSLLVSHLHLSSISQLNCTSLITQLRLMLDTCQHQAPGESLMTEPPPLWFSLMGQTLDP